MGDFNFDIEQLIGRRASEGLCDDALCAMSNKFVAITGAAGSIGSEICRQLANLCNTSGMLLLDNAETPMHELRLELDSKVPDNTHFIIADIRDKRRMASLFERFKPDIVFHAAAYKHVPLMEENPYEAACVNIVGTKNIADLADQYGCEAFVLASTDKAACPASILGATKRIAEMYLQSHKSQCRHISVRFGNVTDSNGSVIPLFRQQIKHGGPVTITDKRMTRYFMTIPEACRLIIEACSIGKQNDTFLFDMGEPVNMMDLAKKMIKLSGNQEIQIVETGIRPGEKLTETLLNIGETTESTSHPRIMKVISQKTIKEQGDAILTAITKSLESCDEKIIVNTLKSFV